MGGLIKPLKTTTSSMSYLIWNIPPICSILAVTFLDVLTRQPGCNELSAMQCKSLITHSNLSKREKQGICKNNESAWSLWGLQQLRESLQMDEWDSELLVSKHLLCWSVLEQAAESKYAQLRLSESKCPYSGECYWKFFFFTCFKV